MKKDSGFSVHWLLAFIILTSFYHFSFYFSPLLNSDSALGILMAQHLQLPQDLYCWGQDRGGNFIPLLARLFHDFTGLPVIIAISIIHYSLLTAGYFGFAYFLKSDILKIALSFFWFLPPWQFVEFLLYPFGIQYSILGILIWLLFELSKADSPSKKYFFTLSSGLVATIGLWISDFFIVSLFSLFLTLLFSKPKSFITRRKIITLCLWAMASGLFIFYGKLQSVPSHNYSNFNLSSALDLQSSTYLVWQSIKRILLFNSESDIQSIFWWFAILISTYDLIAKTRIKLSERQISPTNQLLTSFFSINTGLTFLALFTSKWVLANEMGRRYFTTLFISTVLLIFYRLDQKTIKSTILKVSFLLLGILSLLSSVENFYYPNLKKSKTKYIQEVSTLAPAGLIGDYWNSYVYSSIIPSQLISSPHDKSIYRNIALIEKLFTQPKLYLAKDMWLKTFPDTVRQFGRVLIKDGKEFHLGDCDFCQYRLDSNFYHFTYRPSIPTSIRLKEKMRKERVIDITKFQFNGYSRFDSSSNLKQALALAESNDAMHSLRAKTELDLELGQHEIQFNLRLEKEVTVDNPEYLTLNIYRKNGSKMDIPIPLSNLQVDHYTLIPVEIEVENPDEHLRIQLTGTRSVVLIDRIVLSPQ